jgi:hypothetical protein
MFHRPRERVPGAPICTPIRCSHLRWPDGDETAAAFVRPRTVVASAERAIACAARPA